MTVEEIAKKLSEHNYLKLREQPGIDTTFRFEEYWTRNKEYFIKQAGTYIEVKESLETK